MGDIAVQRDGKVVRRPPPPPVRGATTGYDFGILRVSADGGGLDPAFVGPATGRPGGVVGDFRAVATQADGKILAVGQFDTIEDQDAYGTGYELVGFNPDGTLDRSFGKNGFVGLSADGEELGQSVLSAVKVLPGGSLLVAGDVPVSGGGGDSMRSESRSGLQPERLARRHVRQPRCRHGGFRGPDFRCEICDQRGRRHYSPQERGPAGRRPGVWNRVRGHPQVHQRRVVDRSFDGDGRKTLAANATVSGLAVDSAGRPILGVGNYDGSQYLTPDKTGCR